MNYAKGEAPVLSMIIEVLNLSARHHHYKIQRLVSGVGPQMLQTGLQKERVLVRELNALLGEVPNGVHPGRWIVEAMLKDQSLARPLTDLAGRLYREERLTESETILEALVSVDADHFEAWNDLGVIHFTQRNYSSAEKDFIKALEVDPRYGEALMNLTALYMASGDPKRAVKTAIRSLDDDCRISESLEHEISKVISHLKPEDCAADEELHGDLLHFLLRLRRTHKENLLLNRFEIAHCVGEVRSYPLDVYLNMTNVCNVNCGFCAYNPDTQNFTDFVSLEDVKKMTWLRYAKRFGIWTGMGDSLVNRQFRDIYLYLVRTYPHLEITLSTNGVALNEQLAEDFAGTMGTMNISLNAATAATYKKVMNRNHFDRIYRNMKAVTDAKRRIGARKPTTVFSYVICKENLYETPRFIEICRELNVDLASFKYFISPMVKGRSKISEESSCYKIKEETDAVMKRAYGLAEELGVKVKKVPFLAEEAGELAPKKSGDKPTCLMPWTECHLGPAGNDGKRYMFFCCTGLTKGVEYDKGMLDPDNFKSVWNHPNAQYIRTTVNGDVVNDACRFCLYKDWVDPASQENYDEAKMK